MKFTHLPTELNNNQVPAIIQDHLGFIWIGTFGGLHKYDGIGFEIFTNSNEENTIFDNRIESLFEDSKNNLWVGTYDGICLYNRVKNDFVRYKTETNHENESDPRVNRIRVILEDETGKIWVGSQKTGLFFFNEENNRFESYNENLDTFNLGTKHITSMCKGENGTLWIGTMDDGLKKINTKTQEIIHYRHDPDDINSLISNYIGEVVLDHNNTLWIGSNYEGIDRMVEQGAEVRFVHYQSDPNKPELLGNNDIRGMYVDSKNRVWSCNENGGLNVYDQIDDVFYSYLPDPRDPLSISNNSIWCIYEDSEHRYWVGSSIEGVDIVDRNLFKFDYYNKSTTNSKSLNNNLVRAFYELDHDRILIATDGGGINIFNRKTGSFSYLTSNITDPTSINSNAVLTFCRQNNQRLWVGTWQGGINILDLRSMTFVPHNFKSANLRYIFNIIKDSQDHMWVCTHEGGVSKIDIATNNITTYLNNPTDSNSISNNVVPLIFQDSKDNIWAGTEDSGLNLLTKENMGAGKFIRFSNDPADSTSLPSSYISDIFEDSNKNIWIATGKGLSLFLPEKQNFKTYNESDGFQSALIRSINEDDHGILWLGTSKGLTRFNPETSEVKNYDNGDGLQPGEFSRYSTLKLQSGELLFGGINGFNIFHPDSIFDNPTKPPVYTTGLRIYNKPVTTKNDSTILPQHISTLDEISLSYDHSVITFEFTALNYTYPQKNQYAFMLEGLETEWNYVQNQRNATYTSLNPGKYTFHVIASNNNGIWNMEGKRLIVNIEPPFWGTLWFRVVFALAVIGFVYMVFLLRTRQLQRINHELEGKVVERTRQLNSMLIELKEKQDEIETNNEELTSTMEELYQQKIQTEKINSELKTTQKNLKIINSELDERVKARTSELVKANQELDRFVYSASHDLSAPLKSIEGLIRITRLENKNKLLTENLSHMEKSVAKLDTVIKSLTQFSRNIGHAVTSSIIRLNDLINEILDEIRYDDSFDHIKVIKEYDEEITMESDYLRMKIIISNLLFNAFKYADPDKSDSHVTIRFQNSPDHYILEIEDNGIGIEDENKQKIFDMFYRATEQSKGSGLGLYIVKDTLSKLRGEIIVSSIIHEYSKFTVKIPTPSHRKDH